MATNLTPGQQPGYGGLASAPPDAQANSGTPNAAVDPTNQLGQTPSSIFGAAIPQTTGAPGSTGAQPGTADPTNQPGQTTEGFSGEGPSQIASTGAPGSAGAQNGGAGPDSVKYTDPGSYLSGTYQQDTVSDSVSGTDDWTQAIDGSYGGSKNLPGIAGNTPTTTGAGAGRVLRGGRAVH